MMTSPPFTPARRCIAGTLQFSWPGRAWANAKALHVAGRACFAGNKLQPAKLGGSTAYAYVTYLIGAFGGGVVCPLLLGASPKPLESDLILVVSFLAFFAFTLPPLAPVAKTLYNFPAVLAVGLVLENAFKASLVAGFSAAAASKLGTKLGPIVVGTVAGCGGALVPFRGLTVMQDSVPKGVWSAFAGAVFWAAATEALFDGFPAGASVPQLTRPTAQLVLAAAFSADALYAAFLAPKAKAE